MKMEAYNKRIDEQAYLHGLYVYEAISSVMSGAFAKKKSDVFQYPTQPHSMQSKEEKEILNKSADLTVKTIANATMDAKRKRDLIGQQAILNCY